MSNLYETSNDNKTLVIEESTREGQPFHLVLTLRKLGVTSMLDYFISADEADEIVRTLSATASASEKA